MTITKVDPVTLRTEPCELKERYGRYELTPSLQEKDDRQLYISPPWIDSHVHCFYAVTSFGLSPDTIGYRQGVHLLVDAGSSGAETFAAFRRFVADPSRTKVKAFLNVSAIGHVSMREYFDRRLVDVSRAAQTVKENRDILLGIKVRSSHIIVEEQGIWPLEQAVKAAEMADCPIMVHMGENPPSNKENLALLRGGDIVSHCFHGKQEPLWKADGTPTQELKEALDRGVQMDTAHGAASLDRDIAQAALDAGFDNFSIITDLHIRNVRGPVRSLADTMSKFLALGMPLAKVIRSVTTIPAARFGFDGWGSDLTKNATLFRLREPEEGEAPLVDSTGKAFAAALRIEPVAVLMDGKMIELQERK